MKLTATAASLVETIATASQISPNSTSLAAYTGVLFDVTGKKFTARGSDGDTTVSATIAITDNKDGSVLVPPKPVLSYLSKLAPDTEVSIYSSSATSVEVKAGDASPYKFTALATAFPTFATLRRDKVAADFTHLAAGVSVVRDCAGAVAGGKEKVVQIVSSEAGLRLHSTDRFRLARADLGTDAGFGTFDGLLPLRVLDLIASASPTHVQLDPKGRQVVFHGQGAHTDVVIATRLAQDPYPTVDSVLNVIPTYTAKLDRSTVVAALRRLTALASPGSALKVTIAGDEATFTISNAVTGSGTETVDLQEPATGEVAFAVNFTYAVSAFETYAETTVSLGWISPLQPIFFRAQEPVPSTMVVMPMSVDSD